MKNTILSMGAGILVTATTAKVANAAIVQISYNNAYATFDSPSGGFDLGGDSNPDVRFVSYAVGRYYGVTLFTVGNDETTLAYTLTDREQNYTTTIVGDILDEGPGERSNRNRVAFTIVDSGILGGQTVSGWLDIEASASISNNRVYIHRFVFDDAGGAAPDSFNVSDAAYSTFEVIPEPTSLSLLALAGGCLFARRSRPSPSAPRLRNS